MSALAAVLTVAPTDPINAPAISYTQTAPILIMLGGAVLAILLEAFLPRRMRYPAQATLAIVVVAAALVWTLLGANRDDYGVTFGGAVAVRVGVALPQFVAGVVTFATQSAGCEMAGSLAGRPLLLFHGDRDEILPLDASAIVRDMAGSGELVVLPGDGHLLAKSGDILRERLLDWLPEVLAPASEVEPSGP